MEIKSELPRSFRFHEREKSLLADLVFEFPVIENKSVDALTIGKKHESWEQLTWQFNAANPGRLQFQPKHLKALWKRMKIMTKKAAYAAQNERHRTVGGSAVVEVSGSSLQVLRILSESTEPLENVDDSPSPHTNAVSPVLLTSSQMSTDDSYDLQQCDFQDQKPSIILPAPFHISCSPMAQQFSTPAPNQPEKNSPIKPLNIKKPIQREIDNLTAEHKMRMECLQLDKEIKRLKKWKIQQDIIHCGYSLPPDDFS